MPKSTENLIDFIGRAWYFEIANRIKKREHARIILKNKKRMSALLFAASGCEAVRSAGCRNRKFPQITQLER